MSPLVPIRELNRLALRQRSTDHRRLVFPQPPTSSRSDYQHPHYGVEGKTVVGTDTGA
jgi:hypothetical protein